MLDQHGLTAFAGRAARQLIRWESEYGWTRGDGKVAENETLLAEVLAPLLTTPDMWRGFTVAYLSALDAVAREESAGEGKASPAAFVGVERRRLQSQAPRADPRCLARHAGRASVGHR